MLDWKPELGQVALIELSAGGNDCFTGVVVNGDGAAVIIDLGASPRPIDPECEVTVSFFCPDALYRIQGTLSRHEDRASMIDLAMRDVERVQRRVAKRAKVTLPVALSNLDDTDADAGGDAFASVSGESVDIGEGGCRVMVNHRFPSGCDPTVTLSLSPDETLIALAAVVEEQPLPDGRYEYRLVFTDQADGHRDQLAKYLANA